uniref:Uncharacterized protein n=1 Tax=Physcomitrium patens TaxID=3218 RepID=A0A7I4B7B1_PHYPA
MELVQTRGCGEKWLHLPTWSTTPFSLYLGLGWDAAAMETGRSTLSVVDLVLRARIHYCRFYLLTLHNSSICINKQHYLFASADLNAFDANDGME